jgi:hypothetical protein
VVWLIIELYWPLGGLGGLNMAKYGKKFSSFCPDAIEGRDSVVKSNKI